MQETTDYTPRPFDLQSLDGSPSSSVAPTPPRAPGLAPPLPAPIASALTLSASLIASLHQLSTALEAAHREHPGDREVERKVVLLAQFKEEVLSDGDDAGSGAGGVEVGAATEKAPDHYQLAQDLIAASEAGREQTLRMFNRTLDKGITDKSETLRVMQHDHKETIQRLMQAHKETIRNMNHEREETTRRLVQDIASMVRQERGQ